MPILSKEHPFALGFAGVDAAVGLVTLDYNMIASVSNKVGYSVFSAIGELPDSISIFHTAGQSGGVVYSCRLETASYTTGYPTGQITNTNVATITNPGTGKITFTGLKGTGTIARNAVFYVVIWVSSGSLSVSTTLRTTGASAGEYSGFSVTRMTTSDGGSNWVSSTSRCYGIQFGYSNGTIRGFTVDTGQGLGSADKVYGTTKVGVEFITSDNLWLTAIGAALPMQRPSGNPSALVYYLYVDGILRGTAKSGTYLISSSMLSTHPYILFNSPVIIPPRSKVRIMAGQVNDGGSASAYYQSIYIIVPASDAQCGPWEGTLRYVVDNNGTLTYTNNFFMMHRLLCNSASPFEIAEMNRRQGR